jgi:hypothetical protein
MGRLLCVQNHSMAMGEFVCVCVCMFGCVCLSLFLGAYMYNVYVCVRVYMCVRMMCVFMYVCMYEAIYCLFYTHSG